MCTLTVCLVCMREIMGSKLSQRWNARLQVGTAPAGLRYIRWIRVFHGQHSPASSTLNMYFTIPTSGNIWFTYIARLLFQTKCYSNLHYWIHSTGVWSPEHPFSCHNFTLMCWTVHFCNNARIHARDRHSIAMQACDHAIIIQICICQGIHSYITYYNRTQL